MSYFKFKKKKTSVHLLTNIRHSFTVFLSACSNEILILHQSTAYSIYLKCLTCKHNTSVSIYFKRIKLI